MKTYPTCLTALKRAHKASTKDGRLRYVHMATTEGWNITLHRKRDAQCSGYSGTYWTNGQDAGTWSPGKTSGLVNRCLSDHLNQL